MEQAKIDLFIATMRDKFPSTAQAVLYSQLESLDDNKFLLLHSLNYKHPIILFVISICFGSSGIDRFMLGETGLVFGRLLIGL
ncbi:hypothetical protein [Microbacter margulisiae]|uniref:TM2 domain-containing protein n=1 Tax=Microbacter margulisiae TaxID=1350067 RepID=A0A7W5H2D3_9PORP|nr:hypothetical protein [Microbacter margulisiae]MBB3187296.1 hypothetical protein [Microbacter margulisiae]